MIIYTVKSFVQCKITVYTTLMSTVKCLKQMPIPNRLLIFSRIITFKDTKRINS